VATVTRLSSATAQTFKTTLPQIPAGSLVAGVPAKVRRELTADEQKDILRNAESYRARIADYGR
jgi:carbonic anhydrase/acetyltransferase-like protein (isoleucine patch superfamily)